MRYFQLVLSFFLLFTLAVALPLPASAEAVVARANGGAKAKGGGGGGGGSNAKKEAAGIDKNISIQKQEKKDASAVKKAETNGNFNSAKSQLLSTVKEGEEVRANNQKNADKSNTALVNGLKKVQGAQAQEEKQAKSLTGNNSASDKKTLNKLQGEFDKGIQVNKENKKAALSGGNGGGKGKKGN
ncbi:hypothetical protein CGRA01v4_09941 [Colletotrichum graminicola]|uniref:Small secreted protein n=1 Tax=Colletotrichum graminicola (strain M1.001 / M2 / FGSC 10212) TaxID=645133 RepID=E3QHR2_COLGM|nr:uncharacterized protein GLRG_05544 [Colletotrichum graminicola M1.001]EFQ30400.1 hypothetical protein GLRG_05544 [Colletotrichum graminicola M1.001]WDK18656.1 hypothetical protein CGRA01v4_09941 [Colletotrichum graminicola]